MTTKAETKNLDQMIQFIIEVGIERNWETRKLDGVLAQLRQATVPLNIFKEVCMRENIDAAFASATEDEAPLKIEDYNQAKVDAGLPLADKEGDQQDPNGVKVRLEGVQETPERASKPVPEPTPAPTPAKETKEPVKAQKPVLLDKDTSK